MSQQWEAVIGLEVHAQLLTKSKMFCSCRNSSGSEPNENICAVCTGQPGSLPVVNQGAVELGIRAALALGGNIQQDSVFSRKNYFYPDLPKGYQISQYDEPYCVGGGVVVLSEDNQEFKVPLTRIHFEEDAGKSIHDGEGTKVNLNRAGVPLIEIVTEPVIPTPEIAGQYLRKLRTLLRYAQVCDGNMEQGSFRCDANVSIRKKGDSKLGTRTELKNINSFKFVEKAIQYEIERQIDLVESGEAVVQQTRSWNAEKNLTEPMRGKEEAHDYRYFPEPDLPVLHISDAILEEVRNSMPELPDAKSARFVTEYGLSLSDASSLTAQRDLADYFESVTEKSGDPKLSANWVLNELLGRLNASNQEIDQSPVSSQHLGDLLSRIGKGEISGKIAKVVFDEMFGSGSAPGVIIEEKGLIQQSDPASLEPLILEVVSAHPDQAKSYREGKTKLFGFFVGQVMKKTGGKANPQVVNDILQKLLSVDTESK